MSSIHVGYVRLITRGMETHVLRVHTVVWQQETGHQGGLVRVHHVLQLPESPPHIRLDVQLHNVQSYRVAVLQVLYYHQRLGSVK